MNLTFSRRWRLRAAAVPAGIIALALVSCSSTTLPTGGQEPAGVGARLDALVETLAWQGSTVDTYTGVSPAAAAIDELTAADDIPLRDDYIAALERLRGESDYFLSVSSQPGYEPGVLDSEMFLTGAVDEWRNAVSVMRERLGDEGPSAGTPVTGAFDASDAEAGTVFRGRAEGPELMVIPGGPTLPGQPRASMMPGKYRMPGGTSKSRSGR